MQQLYYHVKLLKLVFILRLIRWHRVLTTNQVATMFFSDKNTAQHRLTRLYELRLVERFRPFRSGREGEYHYVLDQLGSYIVAAMRSDDPDAEVKVRWRTDQALANPVYAGIVEWNGVQHPGTHEPLVSPDIFRRVQELLGARAARGTRERKHPHYLKGLLYCGVCGRRLSVQHSKGRYT